MKPKTAARAMRAALMVRVGGCPLDKHARYPAACAYCHFKGNDRDFEDVVWKDLWSCERRLLWLVKGGEQT